MSKNQELESCPVDEPDCHWLTELSSLRSENSELKLLVTTDTLTGLYNFRYFQENLSIEMERTLRAGRPTSIIMIDLDFFKSINDKWGHEAGNQALKMAATVFKQAIRLSDVVCRYGGEEFVIILPQTTLPTAVNVAERVRLWLEQAVVEFEAESFTLTASLGVGVFSKDSEYTRESFVDSVDQYLYQAKQQGRNQVCHVDYSTLKSETSVSAEEKSALFGNNQDE
ncbi:MAG: GGDEF domain-containing protein [Gammaproteobacteria bacterium]|jgi:diguanylate cyclase (GGDEF)-like protein|nr:GGDEF domain-containing protein [Gammaproteobacteria bacterium]MBT4860559.1 GGDEF domain-containing protein [Gammaproteobacteria bacterium]MBT6553153.1 GGDEF domain-containing protein [Gammaproteobacteria bacterium]MBT7044303.1 GGDEF domain-containing protein [Gammaproteobacteria bacterium]